MNKHPNAIVSAVSGIGIGSIIVQVASRVGVHLDAQQGIYVAGLLGAAALFIGRNGAVGTWRTLKRLVLHGTGSR